MKKYLLDTNICIYYLKGLFDLDKKFKKAGVENCFISEITLAELKYGIARSSNPAKNKLALDYFLSGVQVLPIFQALDLYANEKARLASLGLPLDDFDLLIGATSVTYQLITVTNNRKHFDRITGINIEEWVK